MKAFRHEKRARERSGTKADFHVSDSTFCSQPLHPTRIFLSTGERRALTFARELVSSQRWWMPLHSVEAWRNQHHVWSELVRNWHHHRPSKTQKQEHVSSRKNSSAKNLSYVIIYSPSLFPILYYLLGWRYLEVVFSNYGTLVPLDVENKISQN